VTPPRPYVRWAAAERGLDLGQLARAFLGLLRDIEVVARVPEPGDLIDATSDELRELQALARQAGRLAPVLFDRWARAVDESGRAFAPRLILEMAVCDLCQAEPLEPLGDLLDRLEALEGRLQRGGAIPVLAGGGPGGGSSSGAGAGGVRPGAGRGIAPPTASAQAAAPTPPAPAVRPAAEPALADTVSPVAGRTPAPAAAASPSAVTPPPAAAPLSLAEAWRRVKVDLERRRPRIASALANAHVLDMDSGTLGLGFDDREDAEAVERARPEIEQSLSLQMGSAVRVTTKQGKAVAAPVIKAETIEEADALKVDKWKREQEARQHPIIQRAQDLFGVGIREIKT